MYKLGIDPGISGAVSLLNDKDQLAGLADMPTMPLGKSKQQVNAAELTRIIRAWLDKLPTPGNIGWPKISAAYLEQVSAMPGQGVSGMFNFGVSYGVVQGVLAALGIPLVLVSPVVWKRKAGLAGKTKDRDAARTMAQHLYPEAELGLKKHIGRADAILIARFGDR